MHRLENAAVIVGVAAVIVAAYFLLGSDRKDALDGTSPAGALSELSPRVSDPRIPGATAAGVVPTQPSGGHVGRGAPPSARRTALDRFIALSSGRAPALIPRAELQRAINSVAPTVTPEVARELAAEFSRSKDPGLRWAMSFLFQSVGGDAFVDVLRDYYDEDASRAVQALHVLNTPASHRALAELAEATDDPSQRGRIDLAMARSADSDAERRLRKSWSDPTAPAEVRMNAVQALAFREGEQAQRDAFEIALGPPQVLALGDGDIARSFPTRDLREPAVHALLRMGDLAALQRLLAEADAPGADGQLEAMVDAHLLAYENRGPQVPEIFLERARRKGRLTEGVARYLGRISGAADVAALQGLLPLVADPAARVALEEAISAAEHR